MSAIRDKASRRITGRRLQERRKRWFALHPLCERCLLKPKPALNRPTILDHVVPLFKGGADDESNLQGLCDPCNEEKTAEDLGYVAKPRIGLDGFPLEK